MLWSRIMGSSFSRNDDDVSDVTIIVLPKETLSRVHQCVDADLAWQDFAGCHAPHPKVKYHANLLYANIYDARALNSNHAV